MLIFVQSGLFLYVFCNFHCNPTFILKLLPEWICVCFCQVALGILLSLCQLFFVSLVFLVGFYTEYKYLFELCLITFDKGIHLHNYHHSQDIEPLHHPASFHASPTFKIFGVFLDHVVVWGIYVKSLTPWGLGLDYKFSRDFLVNSELSSRQSSLLSSCLLVGRLLPTRTPPPSLQSGLSVWCSSLTGCHCTGILVTSSCLIRRTPIPDGY